MCLASTKVSFRRKILHVLKVLGIIAIKTNSIKIHLSKLINKTIKLNYDILQQQFRKHK